MFPLKEQVHNLWVLLDSDLLLDKLVAAVAMGACHLLQLVSQLRLFLDRNNLASVMNALVILQFILCGAAHEDCPKAEVVT